MLVLEVRPITRDLNDTRLSDTNRELQLIEIVFQLCENWNPINIKG